MLRVHEHHIDCRAFRLIGDVLVERTVGEALPAVAKNREMLESTIKSMTEGMQELERQLSEMQVGTEGWCRLWCAVSTRCNGDMHRGSSYCPPCMQTKYGIKLVDRQGRPVDEPPPPSASAADKEGSKAGSSSSGRGAQGVLVQK
jgi:hypothetical protein